MLIDVVQEKTFVKVSYVNEKGQIELDNLALPPEGYTKWVICDDDDPDRDKEFKNYDGQSVKRVPSYRFEDLNLTEFLTKRIPKEQQDKLFAFHKPNGFSVDIETEITDDAMPNADTAPNKVLSISITAPNMATIWLCLKEPNVDKVNEILQSTEVWKYCQDRKIKLPWKYIVFDNEYDMLVFYCQMIRKTCHLTFGWNFTGYDWKYITNRCIKHNISWEKLTSPEETADRDRIPTHRLVIDYMQAYKAGSRGNSSLLSYSLDSVAEYELGLHKLDYPMTLKELYRDDFNRFCAYALIDTILVQLIHKKTNKIDVLFNMAYYTKVPFKSSDGNIAQTDALQFVEMYNNHEIYADVKEVGVKEKYEGAFVKAPVYHEVDFPACWDAKSLYPSTMMTYDISPENYIGKCKASEVDMLRKRGFFVSDKLSVYKLVPGGGSFKRLESKLMKERKIYKSAMLDIWDRILPMLEKEGKRRGIELHAEH